MSYDVYMYIFIGGLILSIAMLVTSVLIFFLMNIKSALGDITGKNKQKAIENIHKESASLENNKRASKHRKTSELSRSARLAREQGVTEEIRPQDRYDYMAAQTAGLAAEENSTTVLNTSMGETSVLSDVAGIENVSETTVLSNSSMQTPAENTPGKFNQSAVSNSNFVIEVDITYVHSNEVIK